MRASQFVGRRAQLEDIGQHLYHIMTGQPRVVLVEGIAGIGKSRFLDQVRIMALEMGLQASAGQCGEALTQPYAPFADLLIRLNAQTLLSDLEEDGILEETDVDILREFAHRSTPALPQGPVYHAESDKFRIMMAISRAITHLALQTPLLILVDDLHLADPFSLDLFAYLSFFIAEQRTAPLLLLGSYRQAAPESRLGQLLSRLLREGMSREMELSGLDKTETRALLQDLGVIRPTRQLVSAIQDTTHGIPLFIEEMVPHLIQRGALYSRGGHLSTCRRAIETLQLPPTISDAMAARVQSLSARFEPVFTVAACLGETFAVNRLQSVGPADSAVVWEAIEAGVEAGVLRCESGQFRFAHALIRHAFRAKLPLSERQRLHLQIAQALENLYANDLDAHILEISHHLVEAGDLADARTVVTRMRQAGEQAFAIFAWSEAARYYEAAVRVANAAGDISEQLNADLHYQAGLAHYRNLNDAPALDYLNRAEQAYRRIGDMHGLANTIIWQTMLRFVRGATSVGEMPDTRALYEALDGLGASEPGLRGDLVVILSQLHRQARRVEQADTLAHKALELGRQANEYRVCALAYNALGLASLSKLEVQSSIQYWQESAQQARQANDLWTCSLPLLNLPLALNLEGKLEESEIQAQEGGEVARNIQDWRGYSKALSHLASVSAAKGDFRATEWYVHETIRMVERSHYPWGGFRSLQALAGALALRGLQADAEQSLDKIVEPGFILKSPGRFEQVLVRVFRQLVRVYRAEDMTENIASLCDELMDVVKPDTYSLAPLCAMIELGEAVLDPAVTERPAEMLSHALKQGVVLTSGWCFLIPRVLAVAAVMHEAWDQASAYFVQAIRAAQEMEAWPELARAYLDCAHMILLVRDLDDYTVVHDLLEHASTILNDLGMLPHARLASQMQNALSPS